jgi:hypothetical protein
VGVFGHDLIRETVLADLSPARRAAQQRHIAVVQERQPERERPVAELAWRFAEGDEPAVAHKLQHSLRITPHGGPHLFWQRERNALRC